MLLRLVAMLAASAVLAGCSVFGIRSGTEQVPYELVADLGDDLEVRRYPARVAAEARVPAEAEGEDGDDPMGRAFRLLFDYIKGANDGGREIAMTAPVETQRGAEIAMTAPVETRDAAAASGDGTAAMRFFLPASYTMDGAPRPTDPRLRLVEVPARTLAVLRFSGFGGRASVAEERRALLARLEDGAWQATGEPVALFYDPPWTLPFLRRNEVAVPVERR